MYKISILLVDNLEDGLKQLSQSLTRRYTTVDICDSFDALKSFYAPDKYDIVIIALEMFDEGGYKSVDHVSTLSPVQRIITYSAEPERPSHGKGCEVCLKENKRHRIVKPINLRELYDQIENFDNHCCMYAEIAMRNYQGFKPSDA